MAEEPERQPVERFQQPLVEGEAFPVQRDQAEAWGAHLAAGMNHEAVVEGRLLARGPTQGGPELLLAECDRVIRYHKLSG